MQSTNKSEQIERLKKMVSKQSIVSQSLLTALLIGLAFGLKGIWLDGLSLPMAIQDGVSSGIMAIIIIPALINYFGRVKISELERGQFDWKDYYQPIQPLLILILCIAIALPLKVAMCIGCR